MHEPRQKPIPGKIPGNTQQGQTSCSLFQNFPAFGGPPSCCVVTWQREEAEREKKKNRKKGEEVRRKEAF